MRTCKGCGAELFGRSQRLFCSNACQRAAQRRANVERWLATGEAHAGTSRVHYVRRHLLDEQGHRCAMCGAPDVWRGAPLALVLDHSDGDATNNRHAAGSSY